MEEALGTYLVCKLRLVEEKVELEEIPFVYVAVTCLGEGVEDLALARTFLPFTEADIGLVGNVGSWAGLGAFKSVVGREIGPLVS